MDSAAKSMNEQPEPDTLESSLPDGQTDATVVDATVESSLEQELDSTDLQAADEDATDDDPNAKANGNGADVESAWSAGRLSSVDAESYADEFRPSWGGGSWESPEAAAPSVAVAPAAVPAPEPKRLTPTPAVVSFDDEPAQLVGAKSSTKMLAGVGVAFLVLVGVIIVGFSAGEEPAQSANPPVVDEEPTMEATMAAAAVDPEPEPEPEVVPEPEPEPEPEPVMVRVQIRTNPPNATLEVDGVTVPNPYDQEVAQDGSEHQVRATAPDHNEAVATITYDVQTEQTLTLEPIPEPEPEPEPVMRAVAPVMRATMRTSRTTSRSMRTRSMRSMRSMRTMRASMMSGSGFTSANPY